MTTVVRPSLRDRMAVAYAAAGVHALEEGAEAAKSVAHFEPDTDRHRRAVRRCEFWHGEAERCQAILDALEATADGQ